MARGTQTLVFDLDGTLVDSAPDIAAALNAVLAEFGREVPLDDVKRMVGDGLRNLFDKAGAYTGLDLPSPEAEAAFARFTARYAAEPAARTTVRDWIAEVLAERHEAGARIAVCSNKDEELVVAILDALGLKRYVHGVAGLKAGGRRKPDAESVLRAISSAGGDIAGTIMIGDSGADVGAARSAAVPVILVTGGYGDSDVRELDADRIATNAGELRAAIAELSGRIALTHDDRPHAVSSPRIPCDR
jgi:phosphoglycolate phosphatase